jgi:acyl-CoA oxidase
MAYNAVDNGYARFDQVRIPRTNLFMKSCHLSRQGVYKAYKNREKLLYGGMLNSRRIINRIMAFKFAQALTIAIRYSTVREQGQGPTSFANPKIGEMTIMSYKHQNYRLLSNLAKVYAMFFASQHCDDTHRIHQQKVAKDDHSGLPYAHMLASGLKAWATQTAADGAEDARRCCGGHGYLMISGLPEIFSSLTAMTTLEGDNYVMWQQVAKYLIKNINHNVWPEDMSYIQRRSSSGFHEKCQARGNEFRSCKVLLDIYEHRSARLSTEVAVMIAAPPNAAGTDVWNTYMMQLFSAARAHIELIILKSFIGHLDRIMDNATRTVLSRLTSLFALTGITSPAAIDAIGFVEDGYLSSCQLRDIRSQINDLLDELIPDAIALTDAWNFTDASLCSAIGMKNGNVYETIIEWTRQLPINVNAAKTADVFAEGFETSIKPILRGQLQMRERAKL